MAGGRSAIAEGSSSDLLHDDVVGVLSEGVEIAKVRGEHRSARFDQGNDTTSAHVTGGASRKPPREGGGARALSRSGWPHLGHQIRNVAVGFGEQFQPAQLRTHSLLQQLRGRETPGLYQLVQVVGKINLHAGHTLKYTLFDEVA
jgi:hypothetical protein